MAFDTVEEIKAVVKDSENDQNELFGRMDDDFDWAVGAEYDRPKGYEKYTSTAPQNFIDKVSDGLNRAELSLAIKLSEDADEEERRAASKAELYLFGALNDIDRNAARRGDSPLREALGYFINVRGWYCLKCLVYERSGQTYFDVVPWDPLHTFYDYGSFGLLWIARKRKATKAQILAEYDTTIQGKDAEIIDFFDADRNSVVIEDTFAKNPQAHNLDEFPVLHGAVGSMPTLQNRDFESTLEHRGLSVFSAAKHTFPAFNKYVSQLMDIHERSVVGSLVHQSKTGQKKLKADPFAKWMEIQTEEGETIKALELPQAPEVTAALLGILDTEKQQSMLPYPLAYGGTQEPLSGRALSVLSDATRSVYSPRTAALSRCYVWLAEQLLSQFASKGKKRKFRGYEPNGKFFAVEVAPKDVNKGWFVSAKVEPRMPRDMESDVQTAMMATNPSGPNGERLISFRTAREDIINLRDPDAERDKVLEEYGESLPPVVIMNVAAALSKAGKPDVAKQVLALQPPPGGNGASPGGAGGQGPPQIPPEVIDQIAQVFIEAGKEDLGMAVLEGLGVQLPAPPGAEAEAAPPPPAPVQ